MKGKFSSHSYKMRLSLIGPMFTILGQQFDITGCRFRENLL